MAETKIHVSSGSLAEEEVRKTSSAKVKKMSNKVKPIVIFRHLFIQSKSTAGKFLGLFQRVVDIEKVSMSVPEM